eukprot:c11028_g1_i1 orf=1-204(-)
MLCILHNCHHCHIPLFHHVPTLLMSNARLLPFQGSHQICESTSDLPILGVCPTHFADNFICRHLFQIC